MRNWTHVQIDLKRMRPGLSFQLQAQAYLYMPCNGTARLKNVNKSMNTNISIYLETSVGQSSNLYLNVANFFNTTVNQISVATNDTCFRALVSNTCCCSIAYTTKQPNLKLKTRPKQLLGYLLLAFLLPYKLWPTRQSQLQVWLYSNYAKTAQYSNTT